MTCAKATVRCTIVTPAGGRVVGTNACLRPQETCPRTAGEGYEKCKTICAQQGHAEIQAARAARLRNVQLLGATAYVEGHTYACDHCKGTLYRHGVAYVVIGAPPAGGR